MKLLLVLNKLRVKLIRYRKFLRVRGRKLWHKLNGRQVKWRAYYEKDTRHIVAVASIWPWLTPAGLAYVQFDREPSKRQVLAAVGVEGHVQRLHSLQRATYVETYTRKN